MDFDPAIAALQAFRQAKQQKEFGEYEDEILETEATFSSETGLDATQAYERLQQFGDRLPHGEAFQAFLIFITWQQATEETISKHFLKGRELCDRFLERFHHAKNDSEVFHQITALRASFQAGLGQDAGLMPEFDEDAFHGGD